MAMMSSVVASVRNVSYDPTRELYQDYNTAFAKHWKELGGGDLSVEMSHGGSGKQARSVSDGLEADVVTLALAYDIDAPTANSICGRGGWHMTPANSMPVPGFVGTMEEHEKSTLIGVY